MSTISKFHSTIEARFEDAKGYIRSLNDPVTRYHAQPNGWSSVHTLRHYFIVKSFSQYDSHHQTVGWQYHTNQFLNDISILHSTFVLARYDVYQKCVERTQKIGKSLRVRAGYTHRTQSTMTKVKTFKNTNSDLQIRYTHN